ncbi:MAG: class I SAM-dependent methyltransferase [Spirochaetaceae bacterium]|nr:class I SAM-dependent methyltransferase [Spirochaetaceae bacterium]
MNYARNPPNSAKTEAQAEMLANRLIKRRKHLGKWACRTGAGVYRLYDRDIPEIPLILDLYEPSRAQESPILAGAIYKRPYEKDDAEEAAWLGAMREAAAAALNINPENVILRERKKQRGSSQYGRLADKALRREVCEYGLRYRVNLSDYLDTGLFPDRRLLRALVRRETASRSETASCNVLNLFCYTASLSVAAAAGGAAKVDSVDISNTYLDWARDNFALNGMEAVLVKEGEFFTRAGSAAPFSLIRSDALQFIEEARRRSVRWDMILLDPPAFSNSKKMRDDFDLKRDHGALIAKCLPLLNPGGVLYFSANVKGFTLDTETPERGHFRRKLSPAITNITEQLRDEDFKGRRIPETWRIGSSPCGGSGTK